MLAENMNQKSHTSYFRNAALTNTAVIVKADLTELYHLNLANTNAAVTYVHLYDTAAAITVGTTAPKWSILLPSSASVDIDMTDPMYFSAQCWIACSTTAAGGTAPGTAIVVNLLYK